MAGAPYVRRADPGPRSNSIASLLLRAGELQGNDALARGQARADRYRADAANNAANARTIAAMIAHTGDQVAGYYADAPRRELVQMQVDQQRAQVANQKLIATALDLSEGDLSKAIVSLEAQGHGAAASQLRDKRREVQTAESTQLLNTYKVRGEQFGEANRLIAAALNDPAQYPKISPRLKVLADSIEKGWGELVPEHYDPKALQAFDQFTLTETERAARLKALSEKQERERAGVKSQSELEDWGRKYLAEYFTTIDPQQAKPEDFSGAIKFMKDRGVSQLTLSQFGQDLPSAIAASKKILAPKPEAGKRGDLQDRIKVREAALGRALTEPELREVTRQFTEDTDKTPDSGAGDVGVSDLSEQAMENAAYDFALRGVLPTFGMGKAAAATKARIMNRAAEMFGALDGPAQKAAIEAATASYKKRQEQLSSLSAFEDTAQKNLTRFLELAKDIPDLKSPLFNQPVRKLANEVFGSEKMARFRTALTAVVPEFARIITNPNLVGVLSDDARHHVETMLSGDYTIDQLVGAADELVRDANNRKTSLQEESAALMSRLSAPPKTRAGASAVPDSVKQLLEGQPDDEYELSDGTTWVVKNGVITRKGG